MNVVIKTLVILLIYTIAACSKNELGGIERTQALTLNCGGQHSSILYPGINEADAMLALEGNIQATDRIMLQLTKDKLSWTPLEKCQYDFWLNIAATNGNIQAAYEFGQSSVLDPVRCPRSKFWAKNFMGRIEERRSQFVKGTPESFIQNQLTFTNRQMQATLVKKCQSFTAHGVK